MKNNRKMQHTKESRSSYNYTTGDMRRKLRAPSQRFTTTPYVCCVIEHPSKELAVAGDAEFDSWDRVEGILIRTASPVNVPPLNIAPPIRRRPHERLVGVVALNLRNEAESTVEGKTEGAIL